MTLQSGSPPYDYAVGDPLRVVNPYSSIYVVGGSGIFLEQAQFVITAEIRKFSSSSNRLEDYNLYVNPAITPSGPYEPKVNGSTLGNELNPGNMFIINHITETRSALDTLFAFYESESEHTENEYRTDWLKQIAPEYPLPSGYRRYDPDVTDSPFIVTADVNTLGGSGVLFDLDFAEVMFNPYPWFAYNTFLDVHGLGAFRIVNGPVWPCFQKTNGSFVTLNGREPTTANGINADYDVSHFSSEEVRLDGYALLPQTDYLIGRGLHNFVQDGSFTYVSSATRNGLNGRSVDTARVFASTQALSSGIYKLVARNRREVVPFTAVASGLTSQWPPSGQAYPATGGLVAGIPRPHENDVLTPFNIRSVWYNNQEYEHGYQVFDDAFWIIDHADGDRAPSGLAIASPFTAHCMWLRFAELTQSSGSGVFGGVANSAKSWGGHVGLEKIGSTIYRLQRARADGSIGGKHTALIQRYNEALDYLGQTETADFDSFDSSYNDLIFLPTASLTANEWMFYSTTAAGGLGIDFMDSTFSTSLREGGAFYIGAETFSAGKVDNTSTAVVGAAELAGIVRSPAAFTDGNNATGFTTRGSGIWDLEIGTPGSGTIFKNCKLIDMSKITKQWSSTLGAKIYDMMEVPVTATHTIPGSYVLIGFQNNSVGASERLFLLRISPRDDATAPGFCVGFWDVLAAYDLGTLPSDPLVSVNNIPNMIYKTVD